MAPFIGWHVQPTSRIHMISDRWSHWADHCKATSTLFDKFENTNNLYNCMQIIYMGLVKKEFNNKFFTCGDFYQEKGSH